MHSKFCILCLGSLLNALCAFAVPSDEVQIAPHSRIAIVTGTYSPPHKRHNEIFEQLLTSGLVDYILVIPNDVTPHKPHALEADQRLEMLRLSYKDNPKIIFPHDINIGFPLASKTKEYLEAKGQDLKWFGVMGKDSTQNAWAKLGARLQKVNGWIVLSPESGDENEIPKNFGKTKVTRLYAPTDNDVHSKEIREAAANGDLAALEALVAPEVARYILDQGLYKNPDPKATLIDYLRSCKKILAKKFLQ